MAFVFYDLETTGTKTRFDQILQFAAILTDADLVEQRRVEFECRLDAHVVPHPEALMITGRSIADITAPQLPSHYRMMRDIAKIIEDWTPAIFVGFNSVRFDEEILRHSLYRTLHYPYPTTTPPNGRADVLTLCRALTFFNPGVISVPLDDEGKPRLKLAMLSAANGGSAARAHSAIGDAEAMLDLSRLIAERDDESWSRFLQFAPKKATEALIDRWEPFGIVRFRGNDPRATAATKLCNGRDGNIRICVDLTCDLDWLADQRDEAIKAMANDPMSPFIRVRTNACPAVCELWDLPETARAGFDDAECERRTARIAEDPRLSARLAPLVVAAEPTYAANEHVEDQLYGGNFLPADDYPHLREFHAADWSKRAAILQKMSDPRWRKLGKRLIYLEAPHCLDPGLRRQIDQALSHRRRVSQDGHPWTTFPGAIEKLEELGDECPPGLRDEFYRLAST